MPLVPTWLLPMPLAPKWELMLPWTQPQPKLAQKLLLPH
jgi:hypothetical protein